MELTKRCIRYKNLSYLDSWGVEIKNVHRIVSLKRRQWTKSYIAENTGMKKKQTMNLKKKIKLIDNSVFGEMMEKVKSRVTTNAITSDKNTKNWFSKVNLKQAKQQNCSYSIEMYETNIVNDKP